jgi:hypothetical protein
MTWAHLRQHASCTHSICEHADHSTCVHADHSICEHADHSTCVHADHGMITAHVCMLITA